MRVSGALSTNNGELVHQWATRRPRHHLALWDAGRSQADGRLLRVLPQYSQQADVWGIYPTRLGSAANVRVCVQFLESWLAPSRFT